MHLVMVVCLLVVALVTAARSTWSPCGLSMLSSITPLGERGRGHRFRSTATWYVLGAIAGGASTGAALMLPAAAVRALGVPPATAATAFGVCCALAVLGDWELLGYRIPLLRRQVNEVWLDQFRHQVYGAGFGWQIGTGFATYVMTSAVIALVPLTALTASPLDALVIGTAFGTFRGLTVLMGIGVRDAATLRAAHRRLDTWRVPVQVAVWSALAASAAAVGLASGVPAVAAVALVPPVAAGLRRLARRSRPRPVAAPAA